MNGNTDDIKFTPDQLAAHEFLTELRTRIATQPLPYQFGVEARALESLWEIFGSARATIKKFPGCKTFADLVIGALNRDLRPVTAKWHRAYVEGVLNSRDGGNEFRGALADVQRKLRELAGVLHVLAYASEAAEQPYPAVMNEAALNDCLAPVEFGLIAGSLVDDTEVVKINTSERAEIQMRRLHHGLETRNGTNAVGVAFSGGGVRSATFSLGVAQVLAQRGLLKDVDFLSTVSGGGYTGSFLTTRLGNGQPHSEVAAPHGPDPLAIRYLRSHIKFLTATNLKQGWSMATAALAGMVLNWTAPVSIVAAAALSVRLTGSGEAISNVAPVALQGLAVSAVVALIAYAVSMRARASIAQFGGSVLAVLLGLIVLLLAGMLVASGRHHVLDCLRLLTSRLSITAAGSLAVSIPLILRFVPVLKSPAVRKIVLEISLLAAALIVPLGGLLLFYVLADCLPDLPRLFDLDRATVLLASFAAGSALVATFLIDINLTAPHRLYRGQLAKTFVQTSEDDTASVPLSTINPRGTAPYHLINTALNLPSSEKPALRDRKCDFFLFSKHWCGAPTVGYSATKDWKANGQEVDLATAMAVSGAAVSARMGLASIPTLSALLTFLNVRLGFWLRRPGRGWVLGSPGFVCLMREMTGIGMSEKRTWLNLSDGGHVENMAVYELLRRRCKYIICVDGEADPAGVFPGFITLVRHAQIDFGVTIEADLDELRPDPKTGFSRAHAMFCRVRYPAQGAAPSAVGLLLYIKLSLTGNEPELLKRYRTAHADFPNQTTLDQFFDEEQFEAYRQLGVHAAEGMFSNVLVPPGGDGSIPAWFAGLAANLLEPESV